MRICFISFKVLNTLPKIISVHTLINFFSRMVTITEAIISSRNIQDLLRSRPEVRPPDLDLPADRVPTGNWVESSATTKRLRSTGSCRRSCSSKSSPTSTSFLSADVLKYAIKFRSNFNSFYDDI